MLSQFVFTAPVNCANINFTSGCSETYSNCSSPCYTCHHSPPVLFSDFDLYLHFQTAAERSLHSEVCLSWPCRHHWALNKYSIMFHKPLFWILQLNLITLRKYLCSRRVDQRTIFSWSLLCVCINLSRADYLFVALTQRFDWRFLFRFRLLLVFFGGPSTEFD